MANKDTLSLINDLVTDIVENTNGLISASKLRSRLIDIIQSRGLFEVFQPTKPYYQNEFIAFSDNQIYKAVVDTLAGETPVTHPAKWDVIGSVSSIVASIVGYTNYGYTNAEEALDAHEVMLTALIPSPPAGLSGRLLELVTYAALEAATGVSHNCTDDRTPDGTIAGVYNARSGDLISEIDGIQIDTHTLTSADDTGNYGTLIVVSESDPYQGQLGEGVYTVLDAVVRALSNLSIDVHTYRLIHSDTGQSALLTFNVDDPGTPSISNSDLTLPASATKYVSGVPCLESEDDIGVEITILNAVFSHYHPTRIGSLSSSETSTINIAPPGTPPANGASVIVSGIVEILPGAFSENITIAANGYNSKGEPGTQEDIITDIYVDDVSDESSRKVAGSGQFPSSGYGGVFDPTLSLKTVYDEELQMKNGLYQRPSGNYSLNQPTPGEDYSNGMNSDYQYAIANNPVTLSNASGLTIELNDADGFSNEETADLRLYVKVEGQTGWLDANAAFSLVGSPVNDGDACMVVFESSGNEKRVSFGSTLRSGLCYVRVGLPDGDIKKFSNVTIKDII